MRIRELREKKQISQKELGDALGVSQNTVSNWERGVRRPDPQMLIALSRYFKVTVDYILRRTDLENDVVYFPLEDNPLIVRSKKPRTRDRLTDRNDTVEIIARCAQGMTEKQQLKLLEMAKQLFQESFSGEK